MASPDEQVQQITANGDYRMYIAGKSRLTIKIGTAATVTLFDYTSAAGKGAALIDPRTSAAYSTTVTDATTFSGGWVNITVAGISGIVTVVIVPILDQVITE